MLGPHGLEVALKNVSAKLDKWNLSAPSVSVFSLYILICSTFYILLAFISIKDISVLLIIVYVLLTYRTTTTITINKKTSNLNMHNDIIKSYTPTDISYTVKSLQYMLILIKQMMKQMRNFFLTIQWDLNSPPVPSQYVTVHSAISDVLSQNIDDMVGSIGKFVDEYELLTATYEDHCNDNRVHVGFVGAHNPSGMVGARYLVPSDLPLDNPDGNAQSVREALHDMQRARLNVAAKMQSDLDHLKRLETLATNDDPSYQSRIGDLAMRAVRAHNVWTTPRRP